MRQFSARVIRDDNYTFVIIVVNKSGIETRGEDYKAMVEGFNSGYFPGLELVFIYFPIFGDVIATGKDELLKYIETNINLDKNLFKTYSF